MSAIEITNRDAVAALLLDEPVINADQLGYLDDEYADACRWLGQSEAGHLQTVVLVYEGLSRPGLFTAGDPGGIRPILRDLHPLLPERVTGHFVSGHRDAVFTAYRPTGEVRRMSRMVLHRAERVATSPDEGSDRACVLGHADTAAIMALYAHWPDNFFEPYQLESGLYFGVREGDALVAIAGIHNLSRTHDVANVGNLVTHPAHRGKGYATAVTAKLLDATFAHVSRVTLDVETGNEPAVRTYRRFGFRHAADFFEGELTLK
jgi:GNAT superfamily N-acetyltransferase